MSGTLIESSGYCKQGQSTEYRETERVGDVVVRYTIHLDESYGNQSRCNAEVWNSSTLSWNSAGSLFWSEWADMPSRRPGWDTLVQAHIDECVDLLKAQVYTLLGV